MTFGPTCRCLLCTIEKELAAQLESSIPEYELIVSSTTNGLQSFCSPFSLLAHLKATHADASSDGLYRDLLTARLASPNLVEMLLILAFVPVLHGTVRRIAKNNSHLSRADITQQALSVFLQVLRSTQFDGRQSHFVFAITRLLKRQLFAWAGREGIVHGPARKEELRAAVHIPNDDLMERHALLRHFLYRCVGNGLLADDEVDLLVQIKLDGNTGQEIAEANALTPNAVRQRMKRLLAKLRRIAASR
jgi:DNA-directed RNA polymerase specialized sigma24 family protein